MLSTLFISKFHLCYFQKLVLNSHLIMNKLILFVNCYIVLCNWTRNWKKSGYRERPRKCNAFALWFDVCSLLRHSAKKQFIMINHCSFAIKCFHFFHDECTMMLIILLNWAESCDLKSIKFSVLMLCTRRQRYMQTRTCNTMNTLRSLLYFTKWLCSRNFSLRLQKR